VIETIFVWQTHYSDMNPDRMSGKNLILFYSNIQIEKMENQYDLVLYAEQLNFDVLLLSLILYSLQRVKVFH